MELLKQELKPLTKVVSEWVHESFKSTDIEIASLPQRKRAGVSELLARIN